MAGDSTEDVMQLVTAKVEQNQAREEDAQQQAAAAAVLAEAKQRVAESGRPWALSNGVVADLVAKVVEVDPLNAVRWLVLANLAGTTTVNKALDGGVLGVGGLTRLESAVNAELERRTSTARWLKDGGTVTLADMASKEPRVPLWKFASDKGGRKEWQTAIPGGIVGLVVAPGSTGKTSWLVELAMRTAAGQPFDALGWRLGEYRNGSGYPVKPKFSVMAVLAEEDETGRNDGCRRVWAAETHARKEYNDALDRMRIWYGAGHDTALGEQVQLDDPIRGRVTTIQGTAFHAELCAYARKTGPALIVLDPINQLLPAGMSENDATSAAAIIRLANELRNAAEEGMVANLPEDEKGNAHAYPRPVVLLAHHENKGGGAGVAAVRGSTAFVDNARLVIQMSRLTVGVQPNGKRFTIWEATKSNYTAKWDAAAEVGYSDSGIVWEPTLQSVQALRDAAEIEDAKEAGRKKGLLTAAEAEGNKIGKAQYDAAAKDQAPAPVATAVPTVRLELPAKDDDKPF
jgi:hypothetical protein